MTSPNLNTVEPLTIRFTSSFRELACALHAINGAVPRVRLLRRMAWGVSLVVALLALTRVIDGDTTILFVFIPAIMLIVLWTVPIFIAWMSWRNSSVMTTEKVFGFSALGITTTSSDIESYTDWQAIMRTAESRKFFLFFSSDQAGHFLPKRVMSADQILQLRAIFATYAGKFSDGKNAWFASLPAATVEARFELESDELGRAGMMAARKQGSLWIWYLVIGLVVLANTAPSVYSQWRHGGFGAISIPLLFMGMAPLLIVAAAGPLSARWAAKRQLRTGPSSQGVQCVGVAEWGLSVAGPLYTGAIKWRALMAVNETPEFFLFFLTRLQPVFIPKRVLNDAAVQLVRELARSGMGTKAELG